MPAAPFPALTGWRPAPAGVVAHLFNGPGALSQLEELLAGNGGEIRQLVLHLAAGETPGSEAAELVRAGQLALEPAGGPARSSASDTEHLLLDAGAVPPVNYVRRLREHAWRIGRACAVTTPGADAGPVSYPKPDRRNPPNWEEPLDELFRQANAGQRVQATVGRPAALLLNIGAAKALARSGGRVSPALLANAGRLAELRVESWVGLDAYLPSWPRDDEPTSRRDAEAEVTATIAAGFARVDRLRLGWRGRRRVLMVAHAKGGGIERHVRDLSVLLGSEDILSLRSIYRADVDALTVWIGDGPALFSPQVDIPLEYPEALAQALRDLRISHVHLHSLVELPLDRQATLLAGVELAGLSFDYTWHDYSPLCSSYHLAAPSGRYCGYPETGVCAQCGPSPDGEEPLEPARDLREAYRRTLGRADRVIAPDADVIGRARTAVPELERFLLRPHLSDLTARRARRPASTSERVVGVLGGVGWNKGYHLLTSLAADADRRGLPLKFRIYGFTHPRDIEDLPNVQVLGRYDGDADADRMIDQDPCDCFLFPALAPETYCYTLDIAFRNAIPPVAFDIGAVAGRIREAQFGVVLPLELARTPLRVNDTLLSMSLETGERPAPPFNPYWRSAAAYYGDPAWLSDEPVMLETSDVR